MNGSGSPLQARLEVNLFEAFLMIALLLGVICVVFFVYKTINTYLKSDKYLEAKKNKPTTYKNINELGKICNISKDEKDILWRICQVHRSPNILYMTKDINQLEPFYKEFYQDLLENNGTEKDKTNLFNLRKKIEKVYFTPVVITNSKNIETGTEFNYTSSKGAHYKLMLRLNSSDGMVLTQSPAFAKSEDKPAPLEKIKLSFTAKDGSPFEIETRILRYQDGKDFDASVLVVHTDRIRALERRKDERISIKQECSFASAKQVAKKKGKTTEIKYEHSDKFYKGTFDDVSVGGCSIISTLPIKAGQFLYLQCSFNDTDKDNIVCQIIRTTKRRDNVYVLHIRFVQIDPASINRINAEICGYGKESS